MKLFYRGKDGGPDSKVWGFWLIEWKRFFSIALLRFEPGSRDAYHNHAFNAWSWLLKGELIEYIRPENDEEDDGYNWELYWAPEFIYTPRERFHMVRSVGRSYVLTFRGPWTDRWLDHDVQTGVTSTLTHGRQNLPTS
jgi:hypothetical protein